MDTIFCALALGLYPGEKPTGCVLCKDAARGDGLVLCEGKSGYIMVNRYPYTGGHLMIVPFRHLSRLSDLLPAEREELFAFMDLSVRVLTEAMKPEGFNLGINLGKAAGRRHRRSSPHPCCPPVGRRYEFHERYRRGPRHS